MSRFCTAIFVFKLNPLVFVIILFLVNFGVCTLFIVPYFNSFNVFFWISIVTMGAVSGPMLPSAFMVAKTVLVQHNSFITSVLSLGIALGSIFFQEIAGKMLDYLTEDRYDFLGFEVYKPATVISHMFFIASFFCFVILIPIGCIYKRYVKIII